MESPNDHTKALHTAVWATVHQIVQEEAAQIGKPASHDFVASLANVIYKQMETMALDIEAFSSHARRTMAHGDDVLLCARRNDSLHELLSGILQDLGKKRPRDKHTR
ncbi:kinetochore component CENP-S-domain-containing protein [Chlamydoabsidia padenii]|nr:kinetochore component CENP-S-domain-containing protein [Chlamydoabsidia padenii]